MTAEKACLFISAIRHASMHVRLIMQQLFVNHPPSPPHPHSGWINGSDFGPRCVPVYACLLMSSGSVLVSELGPRQPLLQREAAGEKNERTVKAQPRDHSDMDASCGRKTSGAAHHVLNILHADLCCQIYTHS